MEKLLSQRVIGCAMTVSNTLGAGFLESVYVGALAVEFQEQGLRFEREQGLSVRFKGRKVGKYFADFIVENSLVVELKALSGLTGEHDAQVLNYLRATGMQVGLLFNFGRPRLQFKRIVLNHDDAQPV